MSNVTTVVHHEAQWKKTGDLIEDKLTGFGKTAPYISFFASIPLMMGFKSTALMVFATFTLFIYFILMINSKQKTESSRMGEIENAKNNPDETAYYFAKFGTVVKEFKGETPEQARNKRTGDLSPDNILYEYLVGKSLYTMGILLGGATGAGKTVSLTSTVIHPCIISGTGFLMIEGE